MSCSAMRSFWLSVFIVFELFQYNCYGQLRWESLEQTVQTKIDQDVVDVDYSFVNVGDVPVVITGFHTSCGCTAVALDKKRYLPGESGIVKVVFSVGDRTGVQVTDIVVKTDFSRKDSVNLKLTVKIPTVVKIMPRGPLGSVLEMILVLCSPTAIILRLN